MVKGILFFILIWMAVIIGTKLFRTATNKQRWSTFKTGLFGFVTALVAIAIVVLIVITF